MPQVSLRLPDELHEQIKEVAHDERRSMHAQILEAIAEHVERHRIHPHG